MAYYTVNFETKKFGYDSWIIQIAADNAKDACNRVKQMWQESGYRNRHQFHVRAKKMLEGEMPVYQTFTVIK